MNDFTSRNVKTTEVNRKRNELILLIIFFIIVIFPNILGLMCTKLHGKISENESTDFATLPRIPNVGQ